MSERGRGEVTISKPLGMSDKSLNLWVRLKKDQRGVGSRETASLEAEVSRLNAELKRAKDQGSHLDSDEFNRGCKDNQLVPSVSRRGHCRERQCSCRVLLQ